VGVIGPDVFILRLLINEVLRIACECSLQSSIGFDTHQAMRLADHDASWDLEGNCLPDLWRDAGTDRVVPAAVQ